MKQSNSQALLRFTCLSMMLAAAGFLTGCGGDGRTPVTDEIRFIGLISSVQSAAGTPESFSAIFPEGAAPDDATRERFVEHEYSIKSSQVENDSATLTITVSDLKSGSEVGDVQWKLIKQGEAWLLQDAPLP